MRTTAAIRLNKDGSPDLRFLRRARHLDALEELLATPRSVDELASALGVTGRAVYFFLDALARERGCVVARVGRKADGRYVLLRRRIL
jgi:predicted ArsR family transcriptional regulator